MSRHLEIYSPDIAPALSSRVAFGFCPMIPESRLNFDPPVPCTATATATAASVRQNSAESRSVERPRPRPRPKLCYISSCAISDRNQTIISRQYALVPRRFCDSQALVLFAQAKSGCRMPDHVPRCIRETAQSCRFPPDRVVAPGIWNCGPRNERTFVPHRAIFTDRNRTRAKVVVQ